MATRAEITTKYAREYKKASKKNKGTVLNEVMAVTGWTRDNARRRLTQAAKHPPGRGKQVASHSRQPRARKYSYDAVKILQRVWAISGGQCGKYLHTTMRILLDLLEAHNELTLGQDRYTKKVRKELLAMSPATIDRYLKPVRARDAINGISTTKPGSLLRSAITIRRAGDDVEGEPGFFEGDTVAHCGPVESGEFARTLNLTDFHTGWTFTRTVRNNAHTNILAGLKTAAREIPFQITGLDFDNGSEFLNQYVIEWAGSKGIYFTRSRPYKKNDQATIESKNNHVVRRYGFYYRYDTDLERRALNRLWRLVNDRVNYLMPTIKPTGYGSTKNGRRKRVYDRPRTPFDRLLDSGVLAPKQVKDMTAYRNSLNPAKIAAEIARVQDRLLVLSSKKTEQMYLASFPSALPDVRKGVRVKVG
ncbi:Integrase core domain-containing protein [Brevibacterium sp. 239c]|uniref:integrase catalytic domain-containing protein n=1 Tax=Brevibacterium sp. 239c TaxID=1965356 RepID=UPI000C4EDA84|nr:DDE-type integrase/transposase/recombinase [Brevibacterium sp. 239c]SMX85187.1 Integrase core domain-containing protein [Brevibacterium sp. 239c]